MSYSTTWFVLLDSFFGTRWVKNRNNISEESSSRCIRIKSVIVGRHRIVTRNVRYDNWRVKNVSCNPGGKKAVRNVGEKEMTEKEKNADRKKTISASALNGVSMGDVSRT